MESPVSQRCGQSSFHPPNSVDSLFLTLTNTKADSSDSVDLSESFVLDTGGLCRVRSWDLCESQNVAKDGSFGEKASARGLTFEKSKYG